MLALKHGAHVQIDEVHARMMLLDGEVRSLQVKDAQKHAELKRQREAYSSLMSRLESLTSDLDHFQDELSEQNATDNQLMSDVLRLEEKTSLQDNNHTLNIANLKNEMLLQEKRDQSSLSAVSSEVDQLRSELSQQNSVIAELRETEQNLQSTMKEVAASVTLDLKTLLQQAETKWAADIQKLKQKSEFGHIYAKFT
nr:hypothetical protein BaRGS_018154 [Batillaria attramentaria]